MWIIELFFLCSAASLLGWYAPKTVSRSLRNAWESCVFSFVLRKRTKPRAFGAILNAGKIMGLTLALVGAMCLAPTGAAQQGFLSTPRRAPKPAPRPVVVNKVGTSLQVSAVPTSGPVGTVVAITVHVLLPSGLPPSVPAPTGQLCAIVATSSGTNPTLQNCALTPVTDETWFTPLLPAGRNTITGTYAGDANYNAASSGSPGFVVSITAVGLTVNTQAPPAATLGSAYSYTVPVSGGVPPYSCTVTGLPVGLSGNSTNNTAGCPITGTPTQATANPAVVPLTVTDSATPTPNKTTVNIDPEVVDPRRRQWLMLLLDVFLFFCGVAFGTSIGRRRK